MQALVGTVPGYVHRFTTELVKVMRRISEDHSTQKGLMLAPIRPIGRNPKYAHNTLTPLPPDPSAYQLDFNSCCWAAECLANM